MDTGAATRNEHGQDGEAGIGVGDGAIGSRRRNILAATMKGGGMVTLMGVGGEK
jgi:hypothetical protein